MAVLRAEILRSLWLVAAGSALGGAGRFLVSSLVQERAASAFPMGTFVVNVTGSLLVGFVMRYALEAPALGPESRALLVTGFCGGYTTFSTYSYETVALLRDGDYRRAALYAAFSVVTALVATLLGMMAAQGVLAARRSL